MRFGVVLTAALCTVGLALHADTSGERTFAVNGRANSTPWIASSGSFVAVAWGASVNGKGDLFVSVSRDSGQTFGPPVQVNAVAGEARLGGEIPPRVSLLATGGSGDPEIAVLWNARGEATTIKTARSRDGGRRFDAPVALQAQGAAGDRGWPALALDRRGVAHAIWLDHRGLAANRGDAHAGHKMSGEHDGVAMAQRSGLYYAASGTAPLPERELFKGVCYCCKTTLAVGADGSLYAAWRHVYPGNIRDIAFTASRDGGRSFALPIRVSEDRWELNGCPDDGPAMAVDAGGTIHLVWPTVIGGDRPEGALFYASSRDGRSFTHRVRVPTLGSPKPSHPQIAIDAQGRAVVAWDEAVNGRRAAVARVITGGATFSDPVMLSTDGASSYPVLAVTDRGVIAAWTTGGESSLVRARQIVLR